MREISCRTSQTYEKSWEAKVKQGYFMGGRIYADVKGGCSCGGKYSKYKDFEGYQEPVCNLCEKRPSLYRIKRYLPSVGGGGESYTIRHTKTEVRLDSVIKAIFTLQAIDQELEEGTFNPLHYSKNRKSLKFSNVYDEYLEAFRLMMEKGTRSYATYLRKRSYYKKHLKPFFGDQLIHTIKKANALKLKDSCPFERTSNVLVQELRAFLNWCHDREYIDHVPKMPPVKGSRKLTREEYPEWSEIHAIHKGISNEVVRFAMEVWFIYPLRKSELLVLRYEDIDLDQSQLRIRRHYSHSRIEKGRKSQKEGEQLSELRLDLTPEFLDLVNSRPRNLNGWIFSYNDRPIAQGTFDDCFRRSKNKLGLKKVQAKMIRHKILSEIYDESNNLVLAQNAAGHTSSKTTSDRYVRTSKSAKQYFKKRT